MEKYNLTILLTYHENKESLCDTIGNILKFNENVCVIVNNGSNDVFECYDTVENIHVVQRISDYDRFDTMVPLHLELYDYMVKNNIKSDYVLLMSSNQLFVNRGLYEFMKKYDASYYEREIDWGCINALKRHDVFVEYHKKLGEENFKYQSNHDGMFFKYDIFVEMMNFFDNYHGKKHNFHGEEFLYVAYLIKNNLNLVEYGEYNYWQPTWRQSSRPVSINEVEDSIKKGCFIVKRVSRNLDDEARIFIKGLN
jgi:hypothetical protein